jgi:hypothetical protein
MQSDRRGYFTAWLAEITNEGYQEPTVTNKDIVADLSLLLFSIDTHY